MEVTRADYLVIRENSCPSEACILFKGDTIVRAIHASEAEEWIIKDIAKRNA